MTEIINNVYIFKKEKLMDFRMKNAAPRYRTLSFHGLRNRTVQSKVRNNRRKKIIVLKIKSTRR